MENKEDLSRENINELTFIDIEGKFIHIRVGNEENPASAGEVKDIENKIANLFEENNINCVSFVTHHAVDINIVESNK